MSRDFKVAMVILLPLVIGLAVYIPYSPGHRQRVNMAIAEKELPRVEALLRADGRFKDVQAFVYSGQDGALALVGSVKSEEDLFRLMKAVATEQLPVALHWQVKVFAEETGQ
jgi:hypothetical protein